MILNNIRHYVEGRLLEWTNSLAFSSLAICIFIWPQTIKNPAFHLFSWLMPSPLIGATLLICGVTCIAALLVNGASREIGPRVRAWCALLRSTLLLQFWLSTLQSSLTQGFPFTVVPFWFLLALAEIWVAYRAVLDVRTPR